MSNSGNEAGDDKSMKPLPVGMHGKPTYKLGKKRKVGNYGREDVAMANAMRAGDGPKTYGKNY
jgi:hypothetical protein